jgi:hypothetical protein
LLRIGRRRASLIEALDETVQPGLKADDTAD